MAAWLLVATALHWARARELQAGQADQLRLQLDELRRENRLNLRNRLLSSWEARDVQALLSRVLHAWHKCLLHGSLEAEGERSSAMAKGLQSRQDLLLERSALALGRKNVRQQLRVCFRAWQNRLDAFKLMHGCKGMYQSKLENVAAKMFARYMEATPIAVFLAWSRTARQLRFERAAQQLLSKVDFLKRSKVASRDSLMSRSLEQNALSLMRKVMAAWWQDETFLGLGVETPVRTSMRERWGPYRMFIAFWILGLLNNFLWVTMNAGANSINQAGLRMFWMALLMVMSLGTVAWAESPYFKLLGVAFCSLACGMGEASLLAMSSFYDAQLCLSAWSSGTGFSGIAGYLWSLTFDGLDICFQVQLMVALWIPMAWLFTFFVVLGVPWIDKVRNQERRSHDEVEENQDLHEANCRARPWMATETLTMKERFQFILRLWPYTVPLFWVYAAEYLIQSGFWAAMGFPVTDPISRRHWYKWSNFTYQIGVFISRTFFMCICRNRKVLWLGGFLQVFFGAFFFAAAMTPFGDWWLLVPALCVGFLGGGVYVGAFSLIAQEQPAAYVELALSSASVADTLGMILASSLGFVAQGCIFGEMKVLDTTPDFTCGFDIWDQNNRTGFQAAPIYAKYCFPGVKG
eukprot:symbB.v1.2.020276.t1/scaffold1692.1/size111236/5